MKRIISFLKLIINEALIIFIFLVVAHHNFGIVSNPICSDGVGYYDYLPSVFIHHDLARKDISVQKNPGYFNRISGLQGYLDFKDKKVNKYACGTAVLQLPFFAFTYLTQHHDGDKNDGYQMPYQKAVFYATVFYLFLSIYFLKKLLGIYNIGKNVISLIQILLVLATSATYYTYVEAGFSHIYSLFALTTFMYFVKSYFTGRKFQHFILACLFFGLILILRQINILVILFVPFLAGSFSNLKAGVSAILSNSRYLIIGLLLICAVFSIQSFLWYLQTGNFLVYSYAGEKFNFADPQIINILFSYKKGLFVYTPVTFIAGLGLILLIIKKQFYLAITWLSFFVIITYVLSSWWSWYYGCSFGLRAYIDFYAIFFILLAFLISELVIWLKIPVIVLTLFAVPLNIIQTYQYKEYILHWTMMDRDGYWNVFLQNADRFKGILWKKIIKPEDFHVNKEISIQDVDCSMISDSIFYSVDCSRIEGFEKTQIIQLCFDDYFNPKNKSKIILTIRDTAKNRNSYRLDAPLIHFYARRLNEWQQGLYNFEYTPGKEFKSEILTIELKSGGMDNRLKNIKLKFLSHN